MWMCSTSRARQLPEPRYSIEKRGDGTWRAYVAINYHKDASPQGNSDANYDWIIATRWVGVPIGKVLETPRVFDTKGEAKKWCDDHYATNYLSEKAVDEEEYKPKGWRECTT